MIVSFSTVRKCINLTSTFRPIIELNKTLLRERERQTDRQTETERETETETETERQRQRQRQREIQDLM